MEEDGSKANSYFFISKGNQLYPTEALVYPKECPTFILNNDSKNITKQQAYT